MTIAPTPVTETIEPKSTEHKSYTPSDLKDCWRTPIWLYAFLTKHLGINEDGSRGLQFQMDVCASDEWHLAPLYFTEQDSCLDKEWQEKNWINPPYSSTGVFVDKMLEQAANGREVTTILPADTSTTWFAKLMRSGDLTHAIFVNKRIQFSRADSGIKADGWDNLTYPSEPLPKPAGKRSGNNKGSVIFILGRKRKIFRDKVVVLDRDEIKQGMKEMYGIE